MDNGSIQKDRRLILDDMLQVRVVGFDAQHHFEVVAQVLFVALLERCGVKCFLFGFESAHLVHDVQSLVFGLVQRQVTVVEQVVDIVRHSFVVQIAVSEYQALAFEFAIVNVCPAQHHYFLESVLELDVLVAALQCLNFQLALPD